MNNYAAIDFNTLTIEDILRLHDEEGYEFTVEGGKITGYEIVEPEKDLEREIA